MCRQSDGDWRAEEPSCVYDPQECNLLFPDFDHCIIEGSDIFVSLFNALLLGDLLSHDEKIPGNNLAWKDIDFMPDVDGESKKEGEEWRECRREIVNLGIKIR